VERRVKPLRRLALNDVKGAPNQEFGAWMRCVTLLERGAHERLGLVGSGRLDELGAQVPVAGMGDAAAKIPATGKRRQSQTSVAKVDAPSWLTPR